MSHRHSIVWDKRYVTKPKKPLQLYVSFFVDAGVQTRDVQNAKRLGLKTICNRLDTIYYKFIEAWEIWHKWDKTVNGNTFFSNKVLSLKQDRGFFHRMRARVQIKQAMQWCNVRFLFTYFLSTNHQVCQNWAKIEECGWAIFSPPILSEEFWTADSKCWRRPNQETDLLGTKSFFCCWNVCNYSKYFIGEFTFSKMFIF